MSNTEITTARALGAISNLFAGDKEDRDTALEFVRDNPAMALQALGSGEETGLTVSAKAKAFDLILGEVSDLEEARNLVEDNFNVDQVAEFVSERIGLPSASTQILSPDYLIATILHSMVGDKVTVSGAAFNCVAMAEDMKDRPDWPQILEMSFDGVDEENFEVDDLKFGDFLLLGLWYMVDRDVDRQRFQSEGRDEDDFGNDHLEFFRDSLPEATLITYGFEDSDEAYHRLAELLAFQVGLSPLEITLRRQQVTERVAQHRDSESTLMKQSTNAAAKVAVDLDI